MRAPDAETVRGVRVDDDAVARVGVADRRDAVGMRAAAGYETRSDDVLPLLGAGEIEVAAALQPIPQRVQCLRTAVDHVEYEALEVRRLRDVHRRARRRVRLVGAPRPVAG